MHTAILKLERAAVEEVVNGSGRQDLIGLPEGEDTSGGMDREAANIAGGYLDLAAMDCLSEFEAESSDLRAQQDDVPRVAVSRLPSLALPRIALPAIPEWHSQRQGQGHRACLGRVWLWSDLFPALLRILDVECIVSVAPAYIALAAHCRVVHRVGKP